MVTGELVSVTSQEFKRVKNGTPERGRDFSSGHLVFFLFVLVNAYFTSMTNEHFGEKNIFAEDFTPPEQGYKIQW